MAISTLCSGCRSLLRLPDELAGKQVRCQKCNHLFMVPGVLGAARKLSAPKPPPRPEPAPAAPMPRESLPSVPLPLPSMPASRVEESPPLDGGMPGVVLVEVPIKPTPPPLPESPPPPERGRPEPAPRSTPPMTLGGREPTRKANRPRRPASVLAGLALAGMVLLFVGLFGVSGITWLVTEIRAHPGQQGFVAAPQGVIQPQPMPPFNGGVGNGQINNPGPPGPRFNDKLATKIDLKKGTFFTRTALSNNDPVDPVQRLGNFAPLPCKVFLLTLEANKRYVIEYQRVPPPNDQAFDPYLRVENQEGQRLAEHDDVVQGFNLDSRIEFTPPKTGTYRVFCTVFQHPLPAGQWPFTLAIRESGVAVMPPLANLVVPQAVVTNQAMRREQLTDGDVDVTVLSNPPGPKVETVDDACWSGDGKSFFVLYNTGRLVRVGLDGFFEQRRLLLGHTPGNMALSGQGLVVTIPQLNEVWLINPDDLQVKKRFGVFAPSTVAAVPTLDFAYVASPGQPPVGAFNLMRRGLVVLDLAKDEPVRFVDVPNQAPVVTPDGNLLFALDNELLRSFQIKADGTLVSKQVSGRLGVPAGSGRINVSPDSRFVCVSGANANPVWLQNHPRIGQSPAFVYPVDDLQRPAFGISTGTVLQAVGFDPKTDRVFAHAFEKLTTKPLVVYDGQGRRRAGFALANAGVLQPPRQFLAHPDGGKLLIRFRSKLCYVVFNAERAPLAGDPKFPVPTDVPDAEAVAGPPIKRGEMTYRELRLPNLGKIEPCWDANGRGLLHLETDGTLTRLEGADFLPKVRLALGQPATAMALSAEGLLVALRDQPEVWAIDPDSLKVRFAIRCPSPVASLASHPRLSVAAAVGAKDVLLLDLRAGRVAARGLQDHPDANLAFENPALTPDGKTLFLAHASAGSSKVLRVRVEPNRLVVEEAKATAVKGQHAFCVTADGKNIAWYSKGKKHETVFYPVADWQAPAFTLPVAARAMAAGPDGALYVYTHANETLRFAQPEAVPAALAWPAGRIRDFAPRPGHPGAFMASTGAQVYYGAK